MVTMVLMFWQVLAMSATFSAKALAGIERLMRRPQRIMLAPDRVSLLGVRQYYSLVPGALVTPCSYSQVPCLQARLSTLVAILSLVPGVLSFLYILVASPMSGRACYSMLLCRIAIVAISIASVGCAEASSGQAQLEARARAFLALAARLSFTQAVLFCERQHEAAWLAQRLCDAGFPAAYLSGASPTFETHLLIACSSHPKELFARVAWLARRQCNARFQLDTCQVRVVCSARGQAPHAAMLLAAIRQAVWLA